MVHPLVEPLGPAGSPDVRRANLGRVLAVLRRVGPVSRAGLAVATGLTKATVSAVVTDLSARELVLEGDVVRGGGVGRPGRLVGLAGAPVRAVGVEVNTDHLTAVVLDLSGRVCWRLRVPFDVRRGTAATAVGRLAELVGDALAEVRSAGHRVLGVAVSVPGLVDADAATVVSSPNLPLSGTDLPAQLRRRLGAALAGVTVSVANDADLAATAEFRAAAGAEAGTGPVVGPGSGPAVGAVADAQTATDLVYLTGEVGVGAGIVVGGRVLRGSGGFAGEIGHLPVPDATERCGCGRIGCLETVAGLAALLRAGGGPAGAAPAEDSSARLAQLAERARTDPAVAAALERAGRALGYGVSVLVNVLDPGRVVLGGAFAVLAEHLVPAAEAEMRRRVVAPSARRRLVASTVGPDAAALGAAAAVLDAVFTDPSSVPPRSAPDRSVPTQPAAGPAAGQPTEGAPV